MIWTYSTALPAARVGREWTIGFRYPAPIGNVRLRLRSNGGADAFVHSEVFEHEYYRLHLRPPPATILDLGANIGLAAVYFARLFPAARIACVEPVPENLRMLRQNLELNGVDAEVISAAVDVEDGVSHMHCDAMAYGHRIVAAAESVTADRFEVPALGMPSILERLGWRRIGLLKVDIEGHERSLLAERCEWLHLVDIMCLEYHYEDGERELARVAERFGFDSPRRLSGGIWMLSRHATGGGDARHREC